MTPMLMVRDGEISFDFQLSNSDVAVHSLELAFLAIPAAFTLGNTLLETMSMDKEYVDVIFILEKLSNSTSLKPNSTFDIGAEIKMEDGEKDDDQQPSRELRREPNRIRAHKLFLCQWLYFQSMLKVDTQRVVQEKQIQVQDTKETAFLFLLKFMYVKRLPQDIDTMPVCVDETKDEEASLEDLFHVSHRYDVLPLYKQVTSLIIQKLDASNCIAFLFRSAYMFSELREPVIKIVAKICGDQFAKRSIRDQYNDHPDYADIMGDLFEAHHKLARKGEVSSVIRKQENIKVKITLEITVWIDVCV